MDFSEKTINKNYIYKGKILNLRKDEVMLPDKNQAVREIVEHSGGSAILLVNEKKEILFVKQYRYAYNQMVLEIPAGKLNYLENPDLAAKRELEEETGYKAELKKIFTIYPSPGYTDEIIHLYIAKNYTKGKLHLDSDEFLTSEFIPEKKVKEMMENDEIKDAKTLIALLYYFLNKSKL